MRDEREYRATLYNPQQAHQAFKEAWAHAKAMLMADSRMSLSVRPQTRSGDQNARLHAMIGDIAQQIEWAGRKRDILTWKRLLTAAWLRTNGSAVTVLPALDGRGVDVIYEPTSKMTVAQVSELMEYIAAWGAEQGVIFKEDGQWTV